MLQKPFSHETKNNRINGGYFSIPLFHTSSKSTKVKKKLQNWFHKSNVDFLRKELVILLDGTISQNFCCRATLVKKKKKRKKGKTFWAWLTWKWDDEGKFRHGISPTNSVKQVPTSLACASLNKFDNLI